MERYLQDERVHDFDLELVYDALKKCSMQTERGVELREYLRAYHELCRFFKLTGRLFGFVGKDLESKLSVLDSKRVGDCAIHYETVQSMLEYEINNRDSGASQVSGARALLRLQWSLEFILEFMSKLGSSSDDSKTSVIASEVYESTLSKHHPWLTRKMASFAMYFLPTRVDLISAMCKQEYKTVLELLEKVVTVGRTVYSRTETVYAEHKLLNIP